MITGPQCLAARALAEVSRRKLAKRSCVTEKAISQFESKSAQLDPDQLFDLTRALEGLGVAFLGEDNQGIGVRLKFTRADALQIARLEGEGGIVTSDGLP